MTTIQLGYLCPGLGKHLLREGGLDSTGASASESPGCARREQISFLLVMFSYFACYNLQEDLFLNSISFPSIDSCSAGNTPWSPHRANSAEARVPMVPPQLPLPETEEMNEELQSSRRSITSSTYFPRGIMESFEVLLFGRDSGVKILVDVFVLVVK